MLGGFAAISKEDVKTSIELLKEFFDGTNGPKVGKTRALGDTFLHQLNS